MQFAKRMPNESCMVLDQWLCLKNKRNSFFIGGGGLEIFSAFYYNITPQKNEKIKNNKKTCGRFSAYQNKKISHPSSHNVLFFSDYSPPLSADPAHLH